MKNGSHSLQSSMLIFFFKLILIAQENGWDGRSNLCRIWLNFCIVQVGYWKLERYLPCRLAYFLVILTAVEGPKLFCVWLCFVGASLIDEKHAIIGVLAGVYRYARECSLFVHGECLKKPGNRTRLIRIHPGMMLLGSRLSALTT